MGDQVMRKLDPYMMVRWPLYREATLYKDGGYIKDLSYLNRDLKKVIIIDTDAHHVKHQPENAIVLPKWKGDPNDQTLIQMIPFLEYLATMGFDDARTVLKSFEGKYIPAEFARREKLLREKFEAQQAAKGKPKRSLRVGSWFKQQSPDGLPSLEEAEAQGKMLWDVIRERGQKQYLELEKRIKEEGEKWLAEKEAEEKRMQEEAMQNMKKGWF
ncbi:MAG: mitochondrial inner membrane protein required for protein import, partial [Watsoniomyces obsoletus]